MHTHVCRCPVNDIIARERVRVEKLSSAFGTVLRGRSRTLALKMSRISYACLVCIGVDKQLYIYFQLTWIMEIFSSLSLSRCWKSVSDFPLYVVIHSSVNGIYKFVCSLECQALKLRTWHLTWLTFPVFHHAKLCTVHTYTLSHTHQYKI